MKPRTANLCMPLLLRFPRVKRKGRALRAAAPAQDAIGFPVMPPIY
jgi:hypothetical protein